MVGTMGVPTHVISMSDSVSNPKVWSDREGALPDIGGCLPIEPSHSRSRTCRPSQEQTVPEVTDADVG